MKHEELHEVDVSRRRFLKLGGLLGLAFGALSLPSLGWSESTADAGRETEPEPWQEAKKKSKKKGKRTSGKKSSASESGADGQDIA